MQVWTYHGRVAFVVSVLEGGHPIADDTKLGRLRQILLDIMDLQGDSVVNIKRVGRLLMFPAPWTHPCILALHSADPSLTLWADPSPTKVMGLNNMSGCPRSRCMLCSQHGVVEHLTALCLGCCVPARLDPDPQTPLP